MTVFHQSLGGVTVGNGLYVDIIWHTVTYETFVYATAYRPRAHPESCDMGIPWPCLYEAPQRLLRQGQGLTERCFFMSCLFAVLWHSVPFALLECAPSVCQLSAVRMSCLAPNDPFRIIEKDFVASGFRRLYDQIFSNLYLARIVPLRGGIYVTCQLYTKSLREL